MTTVAIHQPNYMPWLGYFWKIVRADIFIFLDDVQYSKNSLINRVRIRGGAEARWLTVPVSVHLGDAIAAVRPSRSDWATRHRDTVRQLYRRAAAFHETWPDIERLYQKVPDADLAAINRFLIERIAALLGLGCQFRPSSSLDVGCAVGDERLIRLARAIDPKATYLSGRGGASYQDPGKFRDAGLRLVYTDFVHPEYPQGTGAFVSGLSIIDALLHCGREAVSAWLRKESPGGHILG